MAGECFDFKLMSFNVRGLRCSKKRQSIFRFIKRKNIDVCLLQEAHCTQEDEHIWKNEWGGEIFYSHGGRNARGVVIMIKAGFDFKLENIKKDQQGRMIIMQCKIQGSAFQISNMYAPNTTNARFTFFKQIHTSLERLNKTDTSFSSRNILGGDYNTILDAKLDRKGGSGDFSKEYKKSINYLKQMQDDLDLSDEWRIRNPEVKRFTWRQKTPQISSRLDMWLISKALSDYIKEIDIIPSIKSDHSPIIMTIKSNEQEKGRGLWKMNNSFLDEEQYVKGIKELVDELKNDQHLNMDDITFWEYLKFKIRIFSMEYGMKRAKDKRDQEKKKENILKSLDEKLDTCVNNVEKDELENQKLEIEAALKVLDDEKTRALLLRSKCQWYEQGEKSNSYFLRLCSRNKVKSTINKLLRDDNSETSTHKEILELTKNYYTSLYTKQTNKSNIQKAEYLEKIIMPKLSDKDKQTCEGEITVEELSKALKTFQKNKTPGNDGITIEFYQKFWPFLQTPLTKCINSGYSNGHLSTSQRQAVITLLDKGKDRRLLKNWRPISLLNVDYKIATKTIAERMKNALPNIINHNQVGYIKGRQITDNIRTIKDIYFYTKYKHIPGLIINIDFEKAFDSVDWEFLQCTLSKLNFGKSFINWIKTFYYGISSCIINNGVTSPYFNLGRGVRQGDPLSPYLFLLVAEVLACAIRQNPKIKGIKIGKEELKVLQFADDMSGVLADEKSAKAFLKTVQHFGEFSGLKLNKHKTEATWIGSYRNRKEKPLEISWTIEPLRFLGVFISYDEQMCKKLNFDDRLEKCKGILNSWKQRNLTIIGRAQIIKTFIVSQFLYTLNAIEMPDESITHLENLISNFIWRGGRPKLRSSVLKQPLQNGGINIPDVRNMIKTNRIGWVRKFKYSEYHVWKECFLTFLNDCNLEINNLLQSNFSVKSLTAYGIKTKIPHFYLEVLGSWSEIGQTSYKGSYLWYNKEILINKKPVFYKSFHNQGINSVQDLISRDGKVKDFKDLSLNGKEWFRWYGIIQCIKKCKLYSKEGHCVDGEPLKVGDINLKTAQSYQIYKLFLKSNLKETPEIRTTKYVAIPKEEHSIHNIFKRCHKSILNSVSRAFQFQFLNDILVNNYWLNKWKIQENELCTFCREKVENIYHLFWECKETRKFWRDLETLINTEITSELVFYGSREDINNTLIILAKQYINDSRRKNKTPIFQIFIYKMKYIKKLEFEIACKNNNIDKYIEKWSCTDTMLGHLTINR